VGEKQGEDSLWKWEKEEKGDWYLTTKVGRNKGRVLFWKWEQEGKGGLNTFNFSNRFSVSMVVSDNQGGGETRGGFPLKWEKQGGLNTFNFSDRTGTGALGVSDNEGEGRTREDFQWEVGEGGRRKEEEGGKRKEEGGGKRGEVNAPTRSRYP
jgi:hypothetical protein